VPKPSTRAGVGTITAVGTITVVVVEPWPVVRAALRAMLARDGDIEVVGEADSVTGAAGMLRDVAPDVVLVDTGGSDDLFAGLRDVRRDCPGASIVLLGDRAGDQDVFRALQAGAAAHVATTVRPAELAETIRAVASGRYPIDLEVAARPLVARRVLDAFQRTGAMVPGSARHGRSPFTPLTRRETTVLTAISEGMSNKLVANELGLSEHTVRNVVKSVLRKLAVNNRTEAVVVAIRESWIRVPEPVPSGLH
jgi:DNA-binding NarL/FixJ family response regulator